jgi:hypothetical protein
MSMARSACWLPLFCGLACSPRVIDAVGPDPCTTSPDLPACIVVWPNQHSYTNSDPWLVDNHTKISEMHPKLLVLNFNNRATVESTTTVATQQSAALGEGSRYHGYSVASAPVFLNYEIKRVVDFADRPVPADWINPSSTLYPTAADGSFDVVPLFGQDFADRYGFPDPTDSSHKLTLCQLFEQGVINEVWLQAGENGVRAMPLVLERRQAYDSAERPIPGQFISVGCPVASPNCLAAVSCGVTVRLAHLSPDRGLGCDLQVRGWGIEELPQSIPYLAANMSSFLNRDFATRFNVTFDSWEDICDRNGTPCVSYPSPDVATDPASTRFTFDPFAQGCGDTLFPPNARYRWDFQGTTPVYSRCEHFQMQDASDGRDVQEIYTADKVHSYDQTYGEDCGGGWQIYFRQSIPGYRNTARDMSGRAMKNWWPFLFY